MPNLRLPWKPAALLLPFLLTGCFDLRQDIWIHPDGSGRLRIEIGLDRARVGTFSGKSEDEVQAELGDGIRKVARVISRDPRVRSSYVEEYKDDTYLRAAFDLATADWRDLPSLNQEILEASDSAIRIHGLMRFDLQEQEDGVVFYRQPLQAASAGTTPEEGSGSEWVRRIGRSIFDDGALTVVLHSPTISRNNGVWQADRLSVMWNVDLRDTVTRPLAVGTFTAEIGPSARSWHFWRIVGIILAVSALVGLLAWFRRRRRDGEAERAPSGSAPSV